MPPVRPSRSLWVQTGVWAAFALASGLGAWAAHGWLQATLLVLALLFAGLTLWVSLFATFATAVVRMSQVPDGQGQKAVLVPWWVWVPASALAGAVAGTDVYAAGPVTLVAVPLVAFAIAVVVSRRARLRPRTPRLAMVCGVIASLASTAVGLTIVS